MSGGSRAALSIRIAAAAALFAPTVRSANPGPREVRVRTQSGEWYTPLHPELFDERTGPRADWFDEAFVAALKKGEEALRRIVVKDHLDAEVYSFPFLQPRFATLLLEEAQHYNASGLTNRKPNGMNNYGILWNHIGMDGMFKTIQQQYIAPLARMLFPHLGGDSLDHQHSYLVQYSADMDAHGLDIHHDSCDITFNAALDEPGSYEGCGLTFCGLYSTEQYRKYTFTYKHVLGRAIIYDGRMRHGAEAIMAGTRTNLVMWSHSSAYRRTREYQLNSQGRHRPVGGADPRCVSYHHDEDYCQYKLPGYKKRCTKKGRNTFQKEWRAALKDDRYWQVGSVPQKIFAALDSAQNKPTGSGQGRTAEL